MQIRVGDLVTPVGVARANILSLPAAFEFAADLMEARLREELKATAARKAARADIESDLALLQQLLALRPGQTGKYLQGGPPGGRTQPSPVLHCLDCQSGGPPLTVPGSIPADNLARSLACNSQPPTLHLQSRWF